jgi:hypothetical protein
MSAREKEFHKMQRQIVPSNKNPKVVAFRNEHPTKYEDVMALIGFEMIRIYAMHSQTWGDELVRSLRLLSYLADFSDDDIWDLAYERAMQAHAELAAAEKNAPHTVSPAATITLRVEVPLGLYNATVAKTGREPDPQHPLKFEELLTD